MENTKKTHVVKHGFLKELKDESPNAINFLYDVMQFSETAYVYINKLGLLEDFKLGLSPEGLAVLRCIVKIRKEDDETKKNI